MSSVLFTQAYYIHIWDEYSVKPVVYSCSDDKSEEAYEHLFRSLVDHAAEKKYCVKSIFNTNRF